MMRVVLVIIALILTACAVPIDTASPKSQIPHSANDHIPPPGFPVNEAPKPGERSCGGMTAGPAPSCDTPREYCHRDIRDICGAADAPGVCRARPEACTMDYNPVCGCDGKTYPNACAANSNGVSAASKGECPS